MNKLIKLLLISFAFLIINACNEVSEDLNENDPLSFLDIYYINDLHGAITPNEDSIGMAHMANFLLYQKNRYLDETLLFAGGDILQGSALSNATYGASVIEMMNVMGFDAFVIGNHEFDWGLEKVTRYFDHGDDHIATFPLLGANVFHKGTTTIPNGIDPYVIIERQDLRIGIIGTIEYGLESSIATQQVEDYSFAEPGPIVSELTEYLRTEENVDIVLLLSHDRGSVNQQIVYNEDNQKVDAIFNGHSHQVYAKTENGIPVMQSGGYGSHIGHLRFNLNNNQIISFSMKNLDRSNEPRFGIADLEIEIMIDNYLSMLDDRYHLELFSPSRDYNRDELTEWLSKLLMVSTNADVGIHNNGGTRRNLYTNNPITLFTLYDVWPFDNEIVTFYLSGSQIKEFFTTFNWQNHYTDVSEFIDDEVYKIATHDFIYYRDSYAVLRQGTDFKEKSIFLRDLAFDELLKQNEVYTHFNVDNPILLTLEYYEQDEDTLSP